MDQLSDYVQWMGDFPVDRTGFREADALVLCALSYIDLAPMFPAGASDPRVRDCRHLIESGQFRVMNAGSDDGFLELLEAASGSKRFGDLRLSDFSDILRKDPPLQFSAVCFHDDADFSFLAFRGTDSTLAGWKEDFMISIMNTEAQKLALKYAEEQIRPGRHWYLGGHSKGSNLALYASCLLSGQKWDAVERLYLLDGPGICPEVLDLSLMDRIDARTTQIVPVFSVSGKLFAPKVSDTRIIRSTASGFLQHKIMTWGIDHGKLALAEKHDPVSLVIDETLQEWIKGISQTDRLILINDLFDSLSAGGAETTDQIQAGGLEGLEAILRRLSDASETTKQSFSELQKHSRRVRMESLRKKLSALLPGSRENE